MAVKIKIAYFEFVFTSYDDGQNWNLSERQRPSHHLPTLSKDATYKDIPFNKPHTDWDFLHIDLHSGFGLAVNTYRLNISDKIDNTKKYKPIVNSGPSSASDLYLSSDAGKKWKKCNIRFTGLSRIKLAFSFSWPVEKYESFLVTDDAMAFLTWEDPWIMSNAKCHIIFSHDQGQSWSYRHLGDYSPYIVMDSQQRLICTSAKYIKRSPDFGKNWSKRVYKINWHRFSEKNRGWAPLQCIYFIDEKTGYAMTVTWLPTQAPHINSLAILKTEDSGKNWVVLNILKVPASPSILEKDPGQELLKPEAPIYLRIESS